MSQKPLVKKYERDIGELTPEQRRLKLIRIMHTEGFSSVLVARQLNRRAQTVRCWISEASPRNIPLAALSELYELNGYSVSEDFPIAQPA